MRCRPVLRSGCTDSCRPTFWRPQTSQVPMAVTGAPCVGVGMRTTIRRLCTNVHQTRLD
jgi:hypothetical protein